MEPVAGEAQTGALGLGHLVLMVGEGQVVAPAVDVEGLTQQVHRHGHALNVPAGATRPPRGFPYWLARLGCLPESEVQWIGLVGVHLHPGASALPQLLGGAPDQVAVAVVGGHREVHPLALDGVGRTPLHQIADELQHLGHVLGGVGLVVGPGDAEPVHLLGIDLFVPGSQFGLGGAGLGGPGDDLVVDVGDVRHEHNLEAPPLEVPPHHVEGVRGAGVAHMGVVVHRGTAHVHRHPTGNQRLERHHLPLPGVIERDHAKRLVVAPPGPLIRYARAAGLQSFGDAATGH